MNRPIRVCANCRHLELLDQGREFEAIVDTEYAVFRCSIVNRTTREDYLMAPVPTELPAEPPGQCPFWEPWPLAPRS